MYNAYLEKFINEVDEFSRGKFILFENKLAKFLTHLSENDLLYSIIENSLRGFDYEAEFKKAIENGVFTLPNKADKILALVFCLLVEADGKKLDFYKFLTTYFGANDINASYMRFIENCIVPFKNMVVVMCDPKATEQKIEQVKEDKQKEPTLADILTEAITKIKNNASNFKGCNACEAICVAMIDAAEKGNMYLFDALKVALLNVSKNKKFIKFAKTVLDEVY